MLTDGQSVEAPPFKLAGSYAEAFLLVFVSLLYGSGLPILYPLAVFGLSFKFLVGKWAILKVYRDPPMFGAQFGYTSGSLLPVAVLLHCGAAVFIWGRRTVLEVEWAQSDNIWVRYAGRAVGSWHTVPLSVIAVVLVVSFAVWWVGSLILEKTDTECERRYRARRERNDALIDHTNEEELAAEGEGESHAETAEEADAAVPDFSTAVRKKMFVDGENAITSYAIQDNPGYAHAFRHLPLQRDTAQYRRIVVEGLQGEAVSLCGRASPPSSPQNVRPEDDGGEDTEEGVKREWAEKWGEMVEDLLEMYRPFLERVAERQERAKQRHIAATKWRAQNPPKPRSGQYAISRRMWLHQLNEDVAQDRSVDLGPPSERIQPLYVDSLPLTEAWRAHLLGEGAMPLPSAGDIYNPGETSEREFYEYQRVAGAGGGLGAHYFLRHRPDRSTANVKRYPNDIIPREARREKAASQMIDAAEDEFFGGPHTEAVIVEGSEENHPWRMGAPRNMERKDFTGELNRSALSEYSHEHRRYGRVTAQVIVHPFDGVVTTANYNINVTFFY